MRYYRRLIRYAPAFDVRQGVSLLEVMFALAVVVVGLLGAIALLPVAGNHVASGDVADRAAALGQDAFNQFDIRGMGDPNNWLFYNPTPAPPVTPNFKQVVTDSSFSVTNAYCIDPRAIARAPTNPRFFRFPTDTTSSDLGSMQRITLWKGRGGITTAANPQMNNALADLIFVGRDDVVVDTPEDSLTDPATQQFETIVDPNNASNQIALSRAIEGRYSWLATLVPKQDVVTGQANDTYTLSIVVMLNRTIGAGTNAGTKEAILTLNTTNTFPGNGVSGGDVRLASGQGLGTFEFDTGNWVMLAQNGRTASSPPIMRWYRITGYNGGLRLSLYGPDWDISRTTVLVYVQDVVAVYEKIIRIDASNLWRSE